MTQTKKFLLSCLIITLFFSLFFFISPLYAQSDFYPAKVKDISDRTYERAVIDLLDNAKESIVMSMYIIRPLENDPVSLLVGDLKEALARGVTVEVYHNSKFDYIWGEPFDLKNAFKDLKEKGAKIYIAKFDRRLHDKLIIVDNRYVVEGSMNWTVSAIKNNFESAVIIDCPELAKDKLIRLRRIPLMDKKKLDRGKRAEVLPDLISLKISLLEDENLFPYMVTNRDYQAMDMYLLLVAEATRWEPGGFFLSLEAIGHDLGMPDSWSDTAIRRQVIRTLKKLQDKYNLIEADFMHGKDAWIEIVDLKGDSFKIKRQFFEPESLMAKSGPAKFVFLIKTLLEGQGTSIDSFMRKDLYKRFHTIKETFLKGLREIEKGE